MKKLITIFRLITSSNYIVFTEHKHINKLNVHSTVSFVMQLRNECNTLLLEEHAVYETEQLLKQSTK